MKRRAYITCLLLACLMLASAAGAEALEAPAIERASNTIVISEIAVLEEAAPAPRPVPTEEAIMPDASAVDVDITIAASRDGIPLMQGEPVYYGDTIELTGFPENPDGLAISLQWQCNNGGGWQAIEGATGTGHAFMLTEENAAWQYRLLMTITL